MNEQLKIDEANIKVKHRFGWTPKFEESFQTKVSAMEFLAIVEKVFEKLDWDMVFQDENSAEAKRRDEYDSWTEKITVKYDVGIIHVKSISLGREIWDNGRNSRRVRFFIKVFQDTVNEYDKAALKELGESIEKRANMDDYTIPDELPKPIVAKTPKFWIPAMVGLISAILLSYVFVFFSVRTTYIPAIFELGIAIAMAFVLNKSVIWSNYSNYDQLNRLLIAMIVIFFILIQCFDYLFFTMDNPLIPASFLKYLQFHFNAGLRIGTLDTGWPGLLVSWALQLYFIHLIADLRFGRNLTIYQIERVPEEVADFAFYHFVKGKNEDQIRDELAKKGWDTENLQNQVFQAIAARQVALEIGRMA
jgi:hypothetical protein